MSLRKTLTTILKRSILSKPVCYWIVLHLDRRYSTQTSGSSVLSKLTSLRIVLCLLFGRRCYPEFETVRCFTKSVCCYFRISAILQKALTTILICSVLSKNNFSGLVLYLQICVIQTKQFDLYNWNPLDWEYYCIFIFAVSAHPDFNSFDFVKTCLFEISAASANMCYSNEAVRFISSKPVSLGILLNLHFCRKRSPRF